jgi:hypothetical protein
MLLRVHATALRHGPLQELLHESDEPPDRQSEKLLAEPDHWWEGHEEDSSSIRASTVNDNTGIAGIVSLLCLPFNNPNQIVGGFTCSSHRSRSVEQASPPLGA